MMTATSRQVEDVENVIRLAKLEPGDLEPVSQTILFSKHLVDPSSVRLLEITPALANQLENGSKLIIRGDGEESATLCTETETFDVREAETSNSLLLLDQLKYPDSCESKTSARELSTSRVTGIFHRYLEIKKCRPKVSKIRTLLQATPYFGPSSASDPSTGVEFSVLMNTIQASPKELEQGLHDLNAIKVREKWYMLEPDYQMRVLSMIFNFVEENGWQWYSGEIQLADTLEAIASESLPREVVEQIFKFYFKLESNGYSAKEAEVCRFYGQYLLQTGTTFQLDEFSKLWQQALPGGEDKIIHMGEERFAFTSSLDQLKGIALVEKNTVKNFPEWKLPEGVNERLEALFSVRSLWTADELAPYVESLTTPKLNVNALLTKYARASNLNGVKHFSAKHSRR